MSNSNNFKILDDNVLKFNNRIKGEIEISLFRIIITALIFILVLIKFLENPYSENKALKKDFILIFICWIYSASIIFYLKKFKKNINTIGYLSSTLDIVLITHAIYFNQFSSYASAAIFVSSAAFAFYVPVIIYSLRRFNPLNSLYTGILSSLSYLFIILVIVKYKAMDVILKSPSGLIFKIDLVNEFTKVMILALSSFLAYLTNKNFDYLFDKLKLTIEQRINFIKNFGVYLTKDMIEKKLKYNQISQSKNIAVATIKLKNTFELSKKHNFERLVIILNSFNKYIAKIIALHKGYIISRGDTIVAIFGAPIESNNIKKEALQCSFEILDNIDKLYSEMAQYGFMDKINITIGLAYGEVISGFISLEEEQHYIATGEAFELSPRIVDLSQKLNTPLVVTEEFIDETYKDVFENEVIVKLKNSKTIKVYPFNPVKYGLKY